MKLLKQVSIYTFSGFFGAGINFIMMPILSYHLTPFDFGLISLFNTYVTILIPLIGLVAASLLNIEYFKSKSKEEFALKFTSIQLIPIVPFLLLLSLWLFFFDRISAFLELNDIPKIWSIIIFVLSLFTIYIDTFFFMLVIQKKARLYALLNMVRVIIEASLIYWLIVKNDRGWDGRIYSWLFTSFLFVIISFYYFISQGFLRGKSEWQYIKEGILFGAPLILHNIGKFVVNISDRLFITKMISLGEAGIYNMGYNIGAIILIIVNAFFNFYTPFVMERLSNLDENKKLQIVKLSYFFCIGCFLMLLCISFLAPYFFEFFVNERFKSASQYVFWVGLGYFFWGGYMLFSIYISFYKRNTLLGWLAVVNILTNLLFNYYFISFFGVIGAAYATTFSFFINFVIIAFEANKMIKLPWFQFHKILTVRL
jgi:O-antigen/teichoic acid export membrane protein